MKTEKNLQEAFAGESQTNRRYLFFAEKAEREGHPQIARLFRAAAEAETVHARNHFNAMDGVGSTRDNLMTGAVVEHRSFTRVYPLFIEQAEIENNQRAQVSFEYANAVEQVHHGYFENALKALEAGQKPKDEPYFVCQVCGNTVAGEAPAKCYVCDSASQTFKRVE
ncbi:MAG: rubrerythrin family protein [Chloroflexi bacterium]|nr:rubrerythrin family protein [Chloroflexota bacterium]